MEWTREGFIISDDKNLADIEFIVAALKTTYWASGRSRELTERSVENSTLLTLLDKEKIIGMARIVGDDATFAWLWDVYVAPEYRGKGMGKWLVECALKHPACKVRINLLGTRDAHGLYEKYGYERSEFMVKYEKGAPRCDGSMVGE